MLKGKFKIGDKVWTYDHHFDEFVRVEIDSCKIVNNQIIYNGMYAQEDCFFTLKNAYLHECDLTTAGYKMQLKYLASQYAETVDEVNKGVNKELQFESTSNDDQVN